MPGTTTRACATHARGGFETKTRGRRRASRRERAVPRSFFGRSDAEQWLGDALGDGDDTRNASETSSSSSIDAAFASVAKKRRGLALFEAELAKEDEEDVDLLKCACYVSMHQNPDLDCEQVRRDIDEMATVVKKRLDDELGPEGERFPLRTIKTLSRAWAHDLGFTGNVEDYYDVENSCIDRVLARRTGIPITLCLTYMEIAKRCGIIMVDVGIPGHLLCRPVDFGSNCAVDELEEMEILVDAFNQGDIMFIEEVEDILARNSGLAEGQKVQIDRSFLRETKIRKRAFLTRMLTNLRAIYDVRGDDKSTLLILEYMMVCNPYESLRVDAVLQSVERILALESDAIVIQIGARQHRRCFFALNFFLSLAFRRFSLPKRSTGASRAGVGTSSLVSSSFASSSSPSSSSPSPSSVPTVSVPTSVRSTNANRPINPPDVLATPLLALASRVAALYVSTSIVVPRLFGIGLKGITPSIVGTASIADDRIARDAAASSLCASISFNFSSMNAVLLRKVSVRARFVTAAWRKPLVYRFDRPFVRVPLGHGIARARRVPMAAAVGQW
ncbi:Transglutaminase-like superfamily-domain-containing protein [Ostreococcus tauri]|uniref:Transglutaminase-like superfamily-domain-containing protein n=1 Tax=Ostreococcus tauri TaxID=70448 RepID=A0A1Y5IC12_OSTTA|nr:Transglutaminase-like superfamily-domain-containing protein [Ostreococcus tauri]